ncbi:hypothetical protein TrST_g1331 [Triparma strigata]|uniref:START domain-containing protein n=1 Tax=Triparma strigata TaxID=1606541 RepID=A0A9W7BRD0_9STRA|nr:hypothetical protein TrST_g1331 [Triparma strigata]
MTKTGLYFCIIIFVIITKLSSKSPPPLPPLPQSSSFSLNWGWDVITYDHRPFIYKNDFKKYTDIIVKEEGGDEAKMKITRKRTSSQKKKKKKTMQRSLKTENTQLVSSYVTLKKTFLDLTNDKDWNKVAGNKDIKVSMYSGPKFPSSGSSIILVSVRIPTKLTHVAYNFDPKFWSETQKFQDPFFDTWDVIHEIGPVVTSGNKSPLKILTEGKSPVVDVIIGRRLTKRLLTFGRREMIFATFKEEGEGYTNVGVRSINHLEYHPGGKYTRAFQDMVVEMKEGGGGEYTDVKCVMRVDLGGMIPRGIFRKMVGQTGVMAFKAVMKKAMEREAREGKLKKKKVEL